MGLAKKLGKAAKSVFNSPIGKIGLIAGSIALGQPELALGEFGALGAGGAVGELALGGGLTGGGLEALSAFGAAEGFASGLNGLSALDIGLGPLNTGLEEGFNWNNIFNTGKSFTSNLFSNNLTQPTGGTSGGGGINNPLAALTSIGSGIYGMSLAERQRKLAEEQAKMIRESTGAADPWGASGGRAASAEQLQLLNTDPTAAMNMDPRFKAMVQAAMRATAPYGQNSGAMNVAGAQAGGNWYTQRLAELGGLAGVGNAGIPGQGTTNAAQISLAGNQGANTLAGQSLADIGFGVNTATGGGAMAGIPPAVLQWMRLQGMRF